MSTEKSLLSAGAPPWYPPSKIMEDWIRTHQRQKYMEKGAGIILYYVENNQVHMLLGKEGKYITDSNVCMADIYPHQWYGMPHLSDTIPEKVIEYFADHAKRLSIQLETEVHYDQIQTIPCSLDAFPDIAVVYYINYIVLDTLLSKKGLPKGHMESRDKNDYRRTIQRELREEIGITLESIDKTEDDLVYIGRNDEYCFYSLHISKAIADEILTITQKMNQSFRGEMFHISFEPFPFTTYLHLNKKSYHAIEMFKRALDYNIEMNEM